MPELPEVETLRRGLAGRITAMRITAAEVLDLKVFGGSGDAIKHDVVDHQISRMARRGKVLILFLRESGSARLIHSDAASFDDGASARLATSPDSTLVNRPGGGARRSPPGRGLAGLAWRGCRGRGS